MGKLKVNKEEYSFEIFEDGIRLQNSTDDKFIPNKDIFSIRYISLFKVEFYVYCTISLLAFTFWWVLGLILSLYTYAQYFANNRVVLLTTKGQIVCSFSDEVDKNSFVQDLKKNYPEAFKMKKWFQFRKEN